MVRGRRKVEVSAPVAAAGSHRVQPRAIAGEDAAAIVDAAAEAIMVIDRAGSVTYANEAALRLFGRRFAQLDDVVDPEARIALRRLLRDRSGPAHAEIRYQRRSGPPFVAVTTIGRLEASGAKMWLALRDVTERVEREDHYRALAFHDPLTQLGNRALLHRQAERAIADWRMHQRRFALMMLDLDRFKVVNDTLGHEAGDELLLAVAKLLQAEVRACDIVARLGGDEFALVITNLDELSHCESVASRLVSQIAEPFFVRGHQAQVGVSVGIAVCPDDGEEYETLARHADMALYRVKERGRNGFEFFVPDMNAATRRRQQFARDLRAALEGGELVAHFQPVIELASGRCVGAEALARWRKTDGDWVSPADFVAVAEASGEIGALTRIVLGQSLAALREWREKGADEVRVSVNVSIMHLGCLALVDIVENALRATAAPPDGLALEFDASIFGRPDMREELLQSLGRLRELGVTLVIDDFGVGPLDVADLRHWPFDRVKIDRKLVAGVDASVDSRAIARGLVSLAHAMGLTVTAEAVESGEEARALAELGCDRAQGYWFARPMALDEASRWILEQAAPDPEREPRVAAGAQN